MTFKQVRMTDVTKENTNNRANCLNTIRLIAAISVFYIHALAHLNVEMPRILTGIIAFFQGVPIFFAMSGFLVWDSVGRSENFWVYAKKRILRIYPELWCAVLLGLVVILVLYDGPIAWGQLGLFTVTQGTVLQFWTPDCLRGYGCGTPNGALWTIGVTVQFYIVIYFLQKLLRNKGLRTWLALYVGTVLIAVFSPLLKEFIPNIIYKLYRQTFIPHMWLFMLGAMFAANRSFFAPLLRKYWALLLAASAVLTIVRIDITLGDYCLFRCLTLIPGIIGFAYQFPRLNIKIDISYGVYIYHMIVINAMIALGFVNRVVDLLVALLVTCLLAFISERTVGRLAMLIKIQK